MILRGEIPCEFVYEDDQCVAFHDIEKQASTHILIIPRKHINRVSYAEKEDKELLGHLLYVASRIAEQEKLEGFRLLVNNGSAAGQTVFHLHVHLLGGEIRQALN